MKHFLVKVVCVFLTSIAFVFITCNSNARVDLLIYQLENRRLFEPLNNHISKDTINKAIVDTVEKDGDELLPDPVEYISYKDNSII